MPTWQNLPFRSFAGGHRGEDRRAHSYLTTAHDEATFHGQHVQTPQVLPMHLDDLEEDSQLDPQELKDALDAWYAEQDAAISESNQSFEAERQSFEKVKSSSSAKVSAKANSSESQTWHCLRCSSDQAAWNHRTLVAGNVLRARVLSFTM